MYRRYRFPSMWREMEQLQREMGRLVEGSSPHRLQKAADFPAMNVWANEDGQIVTAEVPGVSSGDLDITILGEKLTLSGSRALDELPDGARYHRRERGMGEFSRTVQLPFLVDAGKAEASFENGVLTITLPRAEADRPRRVAVKAA
jgi:HSP20 family protein